MNRGLAKLMVFVFLTGAIPLSGLAGVVSAETVSAAELVSIEAETKGNWVGVYGSDGYVLPFFATELTSGRDTPLADDVFSLPDYVDSYSRQGSTYWTSPVSGDIRALQTPDGSGRKKLTVYSGTSFTYTFNLNDQEHRLFTVYTSDYGDHESITQQFEILDMSNNVLDTRIIDTINDGKYISYMVSGSFKFKATKISGNYAYANGFFFDEAVPHTISDLNAVNLPGRSVELDWNDSAGAAAAILRKKQGETEFRKIAETAAGIESYIDTGLEQGTTYDYALRNKNGNLYSELSEAVQVVVPSYTATRLAFINNDLEVDKPGDSIVLQVKFEADDGGLGYVPIADAEVRFQLGGLHVGTYIPDQIGIAETNAEGIAELVYQTLYSGQYTVTAAVDAHDDELLADAEAAASLLVNAEAWNVPPVIIHASEAVRPGEALSLYGGGMEVVDTTVYIEPLLGSTVPLVPSGSSVMMSVEQYESDEGRFVRTVIPASFAPGVYAVWVENSYGFSDPIIINGADPRWLADTEIYEGAAVKLIGRNLDAAAFGGSTDTEIRLVDVVTNDPFAATVTQLTEYTADFTIGAVPAGLYAVEVRNSADLPWIRLQDESLAVVETGLNPDPLQLGVTWAKDFNWASQWNAQVDFGAAGDGIADDTAAIQAAIDSIADNGGGVLYFPAGTYRFTGVQMRAGVVIRGDEETESIFHYTGTGGSLFSSKEDGVTIGLMGFSHLKITADITNLTGNLNVFTVGHDWGVTNMTASRIFVSNIEVDMPLDQTKVKQAAIIGAKEKVLFLNNIFKGYEMSIYSPFIKDLLQVKGNAFYTANGSAVNVNAKRMILEDNHVVGVFIPHVTAGSFRGLKFDTGSRGWPMEKALVTGNTVEGVGSDESGAQGNDGETLLVENPGSAYARGAVLGAAATTAVLAIDYINTARSWEEEWNIVIVAGKGLGQVRKVTAYENSVVEVDRPWDIVPDGSSKFSVMRNASDLLFVDNVTLDSRGGIQIYHNTLDAVVADNFISDTQGISVWGRDMYTKSEPSYFINIKGNEVSGKSWKFLTSWLGISAALHDFGTAMDSTVTYGVEFKGNRIDRVGLEDAVSLRGVPAAMALAFRDPLSHITGKGMLASLLENNNISNSEVGIYLSSGTDSTYIKGNIFTDVDEPVRDEGTNTTHFTPGIPSAVNSAITAEPSSVPADGSSVSTITVQVRDGAGNPVTAGGDDVDFSTTLGSLTSTTDHQDGFYSIELSSVAAGEATVSASINEVPLAGTVNVVFYSGQSAWYPENAAPPELELVQQRLEEETAHLSINANKLAELLNQGPLTEPLVIEPDKASRNVNLTLTGAAIKAILGNNSDMVIELRTDKVRYELPVGLVDPKAIASRFNVDSDEIEVVVSIAEPDSVAKRRVIEHLSARTLTLVGPIVEVSIMASLDGSFKPVGLLLGANDVSGSISLDREIDPDKSAVIRIDPQTGDIQSVPALFRFSSGTGEANLPGMGVGSYAVISNNRTFRDIAGHWAQQDIELLASKLLVEGYTHERFGVDEHLTRGQFAMLLVRSLGLTADRTAEEEAPLFRDVQADDWYSHAIHEAVKEGFILGYGDQTFRPDQAITREETAAVVNRALAYAMKKPEHDRERILSEFHDADDIAAWALQDVSALVEIGLIRGKSAGVFDSKALLLRGEAAALLTRFLKFINYIN